MSTNVFGSSSKLTKASNIDKKYVDSKFVTLTKNIQLKVDKTGDTMSGNLDMGNSKVVNLQEPTEEQDAVSKKYVDKISKNINTDRVAFNRCGLVPCLKSNDGKTGYQVHASSEYSNEYAAYNVFSDDDENRVWATAGINKDFWIQLNCFQETRIYGFTLRAINQTELIQWKFQGSNNNIDWEDLVTDTFAVDNVTEFHSTEAYKKKAYKQYRIYVIVAIGINCGLSHWQLYSADPVDII